MQATGPIKRCTANVMLDQAYCEAHSYVSPGPYVLLEVSEIEQRLLILLSDGADTGSRMSPVNAAEIAADNGVWRLTSSTIRCNRSSHRPRRIRSRFRRRRPCRRHTN